MVSFDVVSLFTSIPTALALQVTKNRLEADPTISERTNMSVDSIMILLEFVLDNNYFIVDGTFYKQIFGCPMGSPVSAILANLVMEHVEERALLSASHPLSGGIDTLMIAMSALPVNILQSSTPTLTQLIHTLNLQ